MVVFTKAIANVGHRFLLVVFFSRLTFWKKKNTTCAKKKKVLPIGEVGSLFPYLKDFCIIRTDLVLSTDKSRKRDQVFF